MGKGSLSKDKGCEITDRIMAKINSIIDRLLFWLLAAALGTLVAICFVQVVARYLFGESFPWAEEVSIVILLWSAWWGACLGIKDNAHLKIHFIEERITEKRAIILRLSLNILSIAFLMVVAMVSRTVLDSMGAQTLWSLPDIPMNVMYASVPAGTILMIYYICRSSADEIKSITALIREDA